MKVFNVSAKPAGEDVDSDPWLSFGAKPAGEDVDSDPRLSLVQSPPVKTLIRIQGLGDR